MCDSVCRLCNHESKSAIVLKNHVVKSDDAKHKLLAFAYSNLRLKCKELNDFVDKYKKYFDKVTEENVIKMQEKLVTDITENAAKEKAEREMIKRQEKERIRLQRHYEDMKRLAEIEEKHQIEERLYEDFYRDLDTDYRPKALLKKFYKAIDSKCFNYPMETNLIKELYTKHKLQPEQVDFIVTYMSKMGKFIEL